MKLILLKDDKKLGRKDSVVEVKDGYAQYLINQEIAIQATKKSLEILKQQQEENALYDAQMCSEATLLKQGIENTSFNIKVPYNEQNHKLIGSITKEDLLSELKKKFPKLISKTADFINFPKVRFAHEIYTTEIRLYKNIIATVRFGVDY